MIAKEVWELAKKITFIDKEGGFTTKQFNEIFPNMNKGQVFELSPYEAKERVDAYEKEHELVVGDILIDDDDIKYVLLDKDIIDGIEKVSVLDENGCVSFMNTYCFQKVGETGYVDTILEVLRNFR